MRTGLYILLIVGILAALVATAVVFNKSKFQDMNEGFDGYSQDAGYTLGYILIAIFGICGLVMIGICVAAMIHNMPKSK